MTNILALQFLTAAVEIAANEDWRDSFPFAVAGPAIGYPATGNIGNGTISLIEVGQGAPLGTFVAKILVVSSLQTTFGMLDASGDVIGFGAVGVPYTQAALSFTIAQGSTPFAVGDSFQIASLPTALDISGIDFELMVRDQADDIGIVLLGSTDLAYGSLINGGTSGSLATDFPVSLIENITPALYLFDVQAKADGITRRVITGTLNVVAAVTI